MLRPSNVGNESARLTLARRGSGRPARVSHALGLSEPTRTMWMSAGVVGSLNANAKARRVTSHENVGCHR